MSSTSAAQTSSQAMSTGRDIALPRVGQRRRAGYVAIRSIAVRVAAPLASGLLEIRATAEHDVHGVRPIWQP
jgi:hypothetical protein